MTQREALEILKMGHSVYLTGSAGSGKTFLLNEYIAYLKKMGKGVAVTASTGIAATHMDGITIHSWSGLGIKSKLTSYDLRSMLEKSYLRKRFAKTGVLIIDEVSMLHDWQFDLINQVCQAFKEKKGVAFGGMQVVCSGDFFQLPPVDKGGRPRFAIQSKTWQEMDIKICYLEEQHRHEDDILMSLLNHIRSGESQEAAELLESASASPASVLAPTKLFSHNRDVDRLNNQELKKLSDQEFNYGMRSRGSEHFIEILKKGCLAPEELILKKGAKVMFVKNNFEEGYVNGTLGRVVGFSSYDDLPIVETVRGKQIVVKPVSWMIDDNGLVKARVEQLPLRLAWAITIHKSQGMTLDEAEIDLSKSFVEGMGYVALSRVRSMSGLLLRGINEMALSINRDILELDKSLRKKSKDTAVEVSSMTKRETLDKQEQFLQSLPNRSPQAQKQEKTTYDKTKEFVKQKLFVREIARERGLTEGTVIGHLEKIIEKDRNIKLTHLVNNYLGDDGLDRIRKTFAKSDDWKLAPVKEILGEEFSYDQLRLAKLFLKK